MAFPGNGAHRSPVIGEFFENAVARIGMSALAVAQRRQLNLYYVQSRRKKMSGRRFRSVGGFKSRLVGCNDAR